MKRGASALAAIGALGAVWAAGCGYRIAGRTDTLPRSIRTIAIPAFSNNTTRYKLTEQLPAAVAREFIARTRYRVVTNVEEADAVLTGAVLRYNYYPTTYDPATNRASAAQLSLSLDLTLQERATGAILFSRRGLEFRERYEVSVDPDTYFEESDAAVARVCRDVARTVVSAVLERF
jgi:hypothetical protein